MDFDRELPDIGRLIVEAYEMYSTVIEALSLIRNDPVSRAILMVLFAAPAAMGGEELYRRVRELGVDVSRAAFHRRLKRLVESGIVLALGDPSKKTRKGPYILLPAYKNTIMEISDKVKDANAIEEILRDYTCKFIQFLDEGSLERAFYYLDRLEEYYKQQAALIFWNIIASFLKLARKEIQKPSKETSTSGSSIITLTDNLTDELLVESIKRGLATSLIPYLIITYFNIPVKVLYKTIIRKECDIQK